MGEDFNSELGKLKGEELNPRFKLALKALHIEFDNHNDAARALYPLLDRGVISRLFEDSAGQNKYDDMSKRRLIWYYESGPTRLMYKTISVLIGQKKSWKSELIDEAVGDYVYFRYHAPGMDPEDTEYQDGHLSIYDDNGSPCFNHTSYNHKDKPAPEHTGFVFIGRDNMYLLGTRNGVLRLAICQRPNKLEKTPLVGLVLSVRTDRPYDPYAARFVMVRSDEKDIIEQLSDSALGSSEKHPDRTRGEEKFFEITRGDYAWYLLALHF